MEAVAAEATSLREIADRMHPLRDEVLVRRIQPAERVTPSGLVVVEIEQPQWHRAVVIAAGPGKVSRTGIRQPTTVQVGDVVIVGPFIGVNVQIADDPHGEYVVVPESELLAIEVAGGVEVAP